MLRQRLALRPLAAAPPQPTGTSAEFQISRDRLDGLGSGPDPPAQPARAWRSPCAAEISSTGADAPLALVVDQWPRQPPGKMRNGDGKNRRHHTALVARSALWRRRDRPRRRQRGGRRAPTTSDAATTPITPSHPQPAACWHAPLIPFAARADDRLPLWPSGGRRRCVPRGLPWCRRHASCPHARVTTDPLPAPARVHAPQIRAAGRPVSVVNVTKSSLSS
jgi:hypothetical protein